MLFKEKEVQWRSGLHTYVLHEGKGGRLEECKPNPEARQRATYILTNSHLHGSSIVYS